VCSRSMITSTRRLGAGQSINFWARIPSQAIIAAGHPRQDAEFTAATGSMAGLAVSAKISAPDKLRAACIPLGKEANRQRSRIESFRQWVLAMAV